MVHFLKTAREGKWGTQKGKGGRSPGIKRGTTATTRERETAGMEEDTQPIADAGPRGDSMQAPCARRVIGSTAAEAAEGHIAVETRVVSGDATDAAEPLGTGAVDRRTLSMSTDDGAQANTKASVVPLFLEWFAARGRAPTGREAVGWVRDNGLIDRESDLWDDVENMIELAQESATARDSCEEQVADSAFVVAALLLVASHIVDAWPVAIVMTPQDTINFKSARSSTFIVYDAVEGAALFERNVFKDVAMANAVNVYVREFLAAQASSDDAALFGMLSTVAADIVNGG